MASPSRFGSVAKITSVTVPSASRRQSSRILRSAGPIPSIGLIAPPVGLNVYVVNGMARDVPMAETYRGVLPFIAADIVRIGLLIAFPGLALWLVRLLS